MWINTYKNCISDTAQITEGAEQPVQALAGTETTFDCISDFVCHEYYLKFSSRQTTFTSKSFAINPKLYMKLLNSVHAIKGKNQEHKTCVANQPRAICIC